MSYVKILIAIAIVYLVHGYYLTSPSHVQKFIEQHQLLSMKNVNEACEQFTDDIEGKIYYVTPIERWEVEGGKGELCGYMQKGQAAMVLTEGSVTTMLQDMKVRRGSFPFTKATASYKQVTEMRMDGQTMRGIKIKIDSETQNTVEIKRTLTGLKFSKVESIGSATMKQL